MIRQILTTLFCAALFTMILALPSHAEHPSSAPFFCTTMDDAMETVRLSQAGLMDELRSRAMSDDTFKCWFLDIYVPFWPLELMHQYKVDGVDKGMIRARGPDGTIVYLFATMHFLNWLMHQEGT